MEMAEMDGETLGQNIKQDPALRETLLVMMTSVGRRGDVARLEKIGFSAYLTKPVKQSQLYNCLLMVTGEKFSAADADKKQIITRHIIAENKRQKIRILLAEDNVTNQKVALKTLEKLGYRADAVVDGSEAVKALEKTAYDLVLMDCQMPKMDGFEATEVIRDVKSAVRNHKIPVIAMTAHAMKGDREKCIEAGMDDYLTKPVNPKALAEMIEKWLDGKSAVSQSSEPADGTTPAENIFDKAGLIERLMDDEELVKEVIEGFLEDIPHRIAALKEALERGDTPVVQRQAHTIKGASASTLPSPRWCPGTATGRRQKILRAHATLITRSWLALQESSDPFGYLHVALDCR